MKITLVREASASLGRRYVTISSPSGALLGQVIESRLELREGPEVESATGTATRHRIDRVRQQHLGMGVRPCRRSRRWLSWGRILVDLAAERGLTGDHRRSRD